MNGIPDVQLSEMIREASFRDQCRRERDGFFAKFVEITRRCPYARAAYHSWLCGGFPSLEAMLIDVVANYRHRLDQFEKLMRDPGPIIIRNEAAERCLSCQRDRMKGDVYCKLHAAVRDLTVKVGAQCFVVRLQDKQFATMGNDNTFYHGNPPQLVQVLEEHGDEIIVRVVEDHYCKCPPPCGCRLPKRGAA